MIMDESIVIQPEDESILVWRRLYRRSIPRCIDRFILILLAVMCLMFVLPSGFERTEKSNFNLLALLISILKK
jgi:hypothetical protein